MRLATCAALMMMAIAPSAIAQAKAPTQFDVVAVKPHKEGDTSMYWKWTSTGLEVSNGSLIDLLAATYKVKPWLVFGLPPWATSMHWDIQAKVVDPNSKTMETLTKDERDVLMGSIFTDRFGMVAHTESKVQPVFTMTVMPGGLKAKQSPPPEPGSETPKFGRGSTHINNNVLEARFITMVWLADTLSGLTERTVIDKTGAPGEFDLTLKWTPEDHANTAANDNGTTGDAPPVIFEAVKEQLGLKLTADKAPVPTVVVDTLVKPEEN